MTTPNRPEINPNPSIAGTTKKTADNLVGKAKNAADDAMEKTTQVAATQANAAKSSVADEMSGVASALRSAAEEMRSGSPQERTFGQIAEGLADASDALRDKDLSTIVRDATQFARSNPLVFLGGAALIGFAATRFAKASADSAATESGQHTTLASAHGDMS